MKRLILLPFLLFLFTSYAATVDTVDIYSNSMKKNIKAVVIKPDSYDKGKTAFPTVYLLHGHSGNYRNWITRVPDLKKLVDDFQLIIVTPDGAYAGWYIDSPVDPTMQYETFIAKEVPAFIDSKYRTIKNRNARAITGLSMGGHGGLFLGFRHASDFGACGSMSGAFSLEHITAPQYGVSRLLGDTTNKELYKAHTIFKQMETYPKDSVAIIIDCGREDFIFPMSQIVHDKMVELKIPHDYIERPGKHDWAYWRNAIQYQLLFFRNYFDRK
jgi:S-formylglutathione hydrolase FrmB